ncbi:hypothetical protein CC2G_000529 [Coprinopsis cinerea AmutBmut pab1-1]|nr:hypothetical protein CC2G_000529 [Coprinopsis cinerea AmutBmut pab1-1]
MHVSLAQLSPELTTIDTLVHGLSPSVLPAELLLLVRGHLLPLVTAELISKSERILATHEATLLSLLCRDCAAYNLDIYGPSVFKWPWDQFSGPCACRGDSGEYATRIDTFNRCVNSLRSPTYLDHCYPKRKEDGDILIDGDSLQFGPRYLDANHVLEFHLSRETRRLSRLAYKEELSIRRQRQRTYLTSPRLPTINPGFATTVSPRTRGFVRAKTIWDVVSLVLHEQYGCEVFALQDVPLASGIDDDWGEGACPAVSQSDSILEIHRSKCPLLSVDQLSQHRTEHHVHTAGIGQSPSSSDLPELHTPSSFWSLTSPLNKKDRVYISPLKQDEAVIHAHGFRNTSAPSCDGTIGPFSEDNFILTLSSALSNHIDPWVSRAVLMHTRTDLGLDLDYSLYCSTLKASTPNTSSNLKDAPSAGSLEDDNSGVQVCAMGSEAGVTGVAVVSVGNSSSGCSTPSTSRCSANLATEATTSPFAVPTSSISEGSSSSTWTWTLARSAMSMVAGVIRNTSNCYYRTSSSTSSLHHRHRINLNSYSYSYSHYHHHNYNSGCFHPTSSSLFSSTSADPSPSSSPLTPSTSSFPTFSLNTLTPSRLLNCILRLFLTSTSVLGYSLYLTGFLITLCTISIPLAVAKVALTVVCFYSRPSSFRLL